MRFSLLMTLSFSAGLLAGVHLYELAESASASKPFGIAHPPSSERFATYTARQMQDLSARSEMPCPSEGTVLLILGQSNAANFVGERFQATQGSVDWFDGKCYRSAGSTLGSEGHGGSIWPLVGDELQQAHPGPVVFVGLAFGGSSSAEWADPGRLGGLLAERLGDLHNRGMRVTQVLWHQGEADTMTDGVQYARNVRHVIEQVQGSFPAAKFLVSQASLCAGPPRHTITAAQASLVDGRRVFAGPNTDQLDTFSDRYDGCHFSGSGARKVAQAWTRSILAASLKP